MSFPAARLDGSTGIKLCGMTRDEDVDAAAALDVDALGFVFYGASPRHVTVEQAARLVARVPPTIATVGLFVNASLAEIDAVLDAVPLTLVQLHGDESAADAAGLRVPHIKAARMIAGLDLLTFAIEHAAAAALLLDTHAAGYGGSGKVFDWSLVPPRWIARPERRTTSLAGVPRVVLSGGLSAANVADAIALVRPAAVDVSSGIESARGVKDPAAMRAFVAAVRQADRAMTHRSAD